MSQFLSSNMSSNNCSKEQKSRTVLAVDNSGSTGGRKNYHDYYTKLITNEQTYMLWNTSATVVTLKQLNENAKKNHGDGGTCPQVVATLLKNGDNVIIVTDGQVGDSDVQECVRILTGMSFNNVKIHFVNTGGKMNLSVSAPFIRNCQEFELLVDGVSNSSGSTQKIMHMLDSITSPEEFLANYATINASVVAMTMGAGEHKPLHDKICNLNKGIQQELAKRNSVGSDWKTLQELCKTDNSSALKMLQGMISGANKNIAKDIHDKIQHLLEQCKGKSNYSFDLMQAGRLTRAAETKQSDLDETKEELADEDHSGNFPCPITCDDDIAWLLFNDGPAVFSDLVNDLTKKGYLDALMTNPLLALENKDFVDKLKNLLDHPVGQQASLKSYVSPYTRKTVSCAVTCGKTSSHNKATNYALARVFFGNKLVGNPDLWLAVVYFVTLQVNHLASNDDFMKEFREYLTWRFETNQSFITLSALSVIEPIMKAPVSVAVFYCVNSWLLMPQNSTEDAAENRFRGFGSTRGHLMNLLDVMGYKFDRTRCEHMSLLWNAFSWMMNQEKDNKPWKTLVTALVQHWTRLSDGTVLLLDGKSTTKPQELDFMKNLCLEEVFALVKLVDRSKTTNVVMVQEKLPDNCVPKFQWNFGYSQDEKNEFKYDDALICPKTFRPWTYDRKSGKHWIESAEERSHCLLKNQLSIKKYFIDYVCQKSKYSTKEELLVYLADRVSNREENKFNTLPNKVLEYVDENYVAYEKVLGKNFSDVSVADFMKVTEMSRNREVREKMEKDI